MKKIEELSRRYIDYCEDSNKEILDLRAKLHQNREESNQLREELQHVLVQLSDKCSECDSLSRTLQDSRDYMAAIERIKTQLRSTVSLQQSHHQQEERDSLLATFEQQLQHLTEDQEQLHSDCGELLHLLNSSVDEITHIRASQSARDIDDASRRQEIAQSLHLLRQLCTDSQSSFSSHRDADFVTNLYEKVKVHHQVLKVSLFKGMQATDLLMQDMLYFKLLNECENPVHLGM
jgi:DNA repair exonuclease SbcCD ATPase subunit